MVLFQMLFQIAVVQLLGFLMKSSGAMPASAEIGIGAYVGRVALPSLLFGALARLSFSALDPIILTSILIASLTIWFSAVGLGLLITRRSEFIGERQMLCGLMALFVTMGDDIGTGLPVLSVMSFRPDLVPLVFITAALGSLTTAPMGYALLAVGGANIEALASGAKVDAMHIVWQTLRQLRSNVLIISCVVGLAYNLTFGNDLPWYVGDIIDTIGRPFLPLVFFLAGMSSVGSFGSLGSLEGIALPMLLVLLKSILLALLTWYIALLLGGSAEQRNWAFVYSLMPTATSLLVIAKGYGFKEETMSMLCAALMLNKVVSFLFLFVAAAIFTLGSNSPELEQLTILAQDYARIGSLACTSMIVLSATRVPAWHSGPFLRLLVYVVLQLLLALLSLAHTRWLTTQNEESMLASGREESAWLCALALLRWAPDSWLIMMQFNRAMRAVRRVSRLVSSNESVKDFAVSAELSWVVRGGGTAVVAAALALPWTLLQVPLLDTSIWPDAGLARRGWLYTLAPYGKTQLIVYAFVYFTFAVALCVLMSLASRSHQAQRQAYLGAMLLSQAKGNDDANGLMIKKQLLEAKKAIDLQTEEDGGMAQTLEGASFHRNGIMRTRFLMTSLTIRCFMLSMVCAGHAQQLPMEGTTAMLNLLAALLSEGQGIVSFLILGLQPEITDNLWLLFRYIRESAIVHWLLGGWNAFDFGDSPQQVIVHGGGALLLPLLPVEQLQRQSSGSCEYSIHRHKKSDDDEHHHGGAHHGGASASSSKSIGNLSRITSKIKLRSANSFSAYRAYFDKREHGEQTHQGWERLNDTNVTGSSASCPMELRHTLSTSARAPGLNATSCSASSGRPSASPGFSGSTVTLSKKTTPPSSRSECQQDSRLADSSAMDTT